MKNPFWELGEGHHHMGHPLFRLSKNYKKDVQLSRNNSIQTDGRKLHRTVIHCVKGPRRLKQAWGKTTQHQLKSHPTSSVPPVWKAAFWRSGCTATPDAAPVLDTMCYTSEFSRCECEIKLKLGWAGCTASPDAAPILDMMCYTNESSRCECEIK